MPELEKRLMIGVAFPVSEYFKIKQRSVELGISPAEVVRRKMRE